MVCKPSEMTSVTAWMLCELMQKAELPPGVVNMVFRILNYPFTYPLY